MKKYLASFVFIVLFAGYAAFQYLSNTSVVYTAGTNPTPSQQIADNASASQSAPPQNPIAVQTQPAAATPPPTTIAPPTTVSAPAPQGQYVDGTYTGSVVDAYYGYVQVQVTISRGKIADVQFLQYPNDRSTSRYINGQAMPILRQEAIQAQNAQVNGVSGASDTSFAFQQSLSTALSQARS